MRRNLAIALIAAASLSAAAPAQQDSPDTPPPPPQPEGVEVLTRGPVHEAFAEPVVFDPKPGVVVPKAPPQAIEEMPPDQKPTGESVAWIGGYWAWDDERDDFLWVSGIWRDIPPGRQWVPGYWNELQGGHQWINGYWASTEQDQSEYLPQPPATLEAGPNIPAPSTDHAWAPGCWYWIDQRYAWRPGYWFVVRPNWVWVPAHYVCTPGGYLFVDGYWDYVVSRRGLLFAPVYVPPTVIVQPAFVYTPTVVIQETVLVDHLWCRPSYGFYYFGDYYAPRYAQSGFSFWLSFGSSRAGYDPIYVQQSYVRRRVDVRWESRVREVYRERVVNVSARPPRTFAEQHRVARDRRVAASLADVAQARADMVTARGAAVEARAAAIQSRHDVTRTRLEQLGETRRAQIAERSRALRDFQQQRQQREARLATQAQQARETRSERLSDARERAGQARAERAERSGDAQEKVRQARESRAIEQPRSPIAARPLPAQARPPRSPAPRAERVSPPALAQRPAAPKPQMAPRPVPPPSVGERRGAAQKKSEPPPTIGERRKTAAPRPTDRPRSLDSAPAQRRPGPEALANASPRQAPPAPRTPISVDAPRVKGSRPQPSAAESPKRPGSPRRDPRTKDQKPR